MGAVAPVGQLPAWSSPSSLEEDLGSTNPSSPPLLFAAPGLTGAGGEHSALEGGMEALRSHSDRPSQASRGPFTVLALTHPHARTQSLLTQRSHPTTELATLSQHVQGAAAMPDYRPSLSGVPLAPSPS